jgi:ribosomal protein L24
MPIKIGDTVTIISGFHKKNWEIIKINKKTGKILVQELILSLNILNQIQKIGEIKQFEAPIHHSNVKLNLKEVS